MLAGIGRRKEKFCCEGMKNSIRRFREYIEIGYLRSLIVLAKIIVVVGVRKGGKQSHIAPTASRCPLQGFLDRSFCDNDKIYAFPDMRRGTIQSVNNRITAWAWELIVGMVHHAINDERGFAGSEQFREFHLAAARRWRLHRTRNPP